MQAAHWTCSGKNEIQAWLAHVDFFFPFLSPFDRVCFWGTFFFLPPLSAAGPPPPPPQLPTHPHPPYLPTRQVPTRSNIPSYQPIYVFINRHNFAAVENDDRMDNMRLLQQKKISISVRIRVWYSLQKLTLNTKVHT